MYFHSRKKKILSSSLFGWTCNLKKPPHNEYWRELEHETMDLKYISKHLLWSLKEARLRAEMHLCVKGIILPWLVQKMVQGEEHRRRFGRHQAWETQGLKQMYSDLTLHYLYSLSLSLDKLKGNSTTSANILLKLELSCDMKRSSQHRLRQCLG